MNNNSRLRKVAAVLATAMLAPTAIAQPANGVPPPGSAATPAKPTAGGGQTGEDGEDENGGGTRAGTWFNEISDNLSVGLGVFTLPDDDIVEATIENGIVRITEQRKMRAGPWFQANWVCENCWQKKPNMKPGFFAGVELFSGDDLVRSVGLGALIQFRRDQKSKPRGKNSDQEGTVSEGSTKRKNPLNIGIGLHWTSIQVLGSGLVEDQPIPAGLESIRYRKETQPGILLNLSFGF